MGDGLWSEWYKDVEVEMDVAERQAAVIGRLCEAHSGGVGAAGDDMKSGPALSSVLVARIGWPACGGHAYAAADGVAGCTVLKHHRDNP